MSLNQFHHKAKSKEKSKLNNFSMNNNYKKNKTKLMNLWPHKF